MKLETCAYDDIQKRLDNSVVELQALLHDQLEADHVDGELPRGGNDSADEGNQMADLEMEMTQTSRTKYQLELTRNALTKLRNGSLGECEDCGKEIGIKRLLANPIAKRCVSCQAKHEA